MAPSKISPFFPQGHQRFKAIKRKYIEFHAQIHTILHPTICVHSERRRQSSSSSLRRRSINLTFYASLPTCNMSSTVGRSKRKRNIDGGKKTTKVPRLQLHQRRIIIIVIDHHGYQPKIISHGVHRLQYTGIVITFRQDMKRLVGLGRELMVSTL